MSYVMTAWDCVMCYAYGSSEYLGGVQPMAQFPFSLLTQMV